jgi:beta-lactamase class A
MVVRAYLNLLPAATSTALEQRLKVLEEQSNGKLGVAALCIETGQQVGLHSQEACSMASTYKLPIAITFLNQVHQRKHRLFETITLASFDLRPGYSPLVEQVRPAGALRLSKQELLRHMMQESDNSACDKVLQPIGGTGAVNQYLRRVGITGIRVDRSEALLTAHSRGVFTEQPDADWSIARFDSLAAAVPAPECSRAFRAFIDDPRDTAQPLAMVSLLEKFYRRKLTEFIHYELLLDMMRATTTGPKRIIGLLPKEATIAHKTGTNYTIDGINGATNAVGIITAPGGKHHILLAVYLKGSPWTAKAERCYYCPNGKRNL